MPGDELDHDLDEAEPGEEPPAVTASGRDGVGESGDDGRVGADAEVPDAEGPEVEASDETPAADPLAELTRERDDLRGTLQRVQADFENFRKRIMRDQAGQVQQAHAGLIDQLLPVLDSFELALLSVPADGVGDAAEKLKKGTELVYAELLSTLEKAGLERVEALGKPFDPEEHDAVMRDDGEGEPLVREVLRAGYRLKGRILRPAMVRVGPAPQGS